MANITITWKAFGDRPERNRYISSVSFELGIGTHLDTEVMDAIYRDTNTYSGYIWAKIESLLSPTRTHTALSVGDEISIDNRTYKVADFGFELVGA